MPTVQNLLDQSRTNIRGDIELSMLDAEIVLAHTLDKSRVWLLANPNYQPTQAQQQTFTTLWQQRCQHAPIAYLTGTKEFYGLEFLINPSVLIPRPDSELLIDLALEYIRDERCNVLDLGTGSGALAVTLAHLKPQWTILATDIQPEALAVARANAEKHQVKEWVQCIESDWFTSVPQQSFDLIISNPPYIDTQDDMLSQSSRRYEPHVALFAQEQGLACYKSIFFQAREFCHQQTLILVEHGFRQQQQVQAIAQDAGFRVIAAHKDITNMPRVLVARL